MDSLTAESRAETLAKVAPLLEEGRHEEALPFFELHKSKSDDPIWSYLMALSLACLARGPEGLPLLERAAESPEFQSAFGIPAELNTLARTTALNHLMFETSVEASAVEPWRILRRYAQLLGHREYQAKSLVGEMKLDPENPDVVERFLEVFEEAPPDKVIPILDDVVNSRPTACQPRALLGSFLQQRGKTALAIRHLKTALESDPTAMEPHLYLGKIYLSQARFDDAEKELSEAMKKGERPTVALLVEVANCQRATYRYEEALQTLFQAFEIHPPTFRHWDQLVDTAQNTGHSGQLVEALRKAADRFPDDARLRQRFAMVAFRQGEPLAARDQLRATGIFENPNKDSALARLASEVALALGEPGTSVHLVETLWKASPNSPETSRLYGDALVADGRVDEAEALLRETAKNNPNDRALQVSWGRALLAQGDAERAHRAFGLASRLDPDDPEAMAEQGRAMLLLGLHDEAQNVLKESAKKVDPPLAVTLTGLGAVYERKNLRDIARDFYRQALTRQPDRLDAACGMVRTRPEDGSATLASDVLELRGQLPTPFAALKLWLTLLRAAFMEGQPKEARALKEKVYPEVSKTLSESYKAFLENAEVRALTKLSKDLESQGEPEKAREIWRYAVSSPLAELSGKAAIELRRLDTYESSAAPAVRAASPAGGEEDPLLSLLSTTLPDDDEESPLFASDTPRAGSVPAQEADLFLDESAAGSGDAGQDVPLFADSGETRPDSPSPSGGDDILEALFALDAPMAKTEEPQPVASQPALEESLFAAEPAQSAPEPEDPISSLLAMTAPLAPPAPAAEPAPAAFVEQPVTPALSHPVEDTPAAAPPDDLFVDLPLPGQAAQAPAPAEAEEAPLFPELSEAGESGQSDPSEGSPPSFEIPLPDEAAPLAPAQPVAPAQAAPPAPPAAAEPVDASAPSAVESTPPPTEPAVPAAPAAPASAAPAPAEVAPLTASSADQDQPAGELAPMAPDPASSPAQVSVALDAAAEASPLPSPVVREELLPIPMPADFSPLTRRQLHYHEALASSASGMVNPESLAHLLLQSAVGHEPPDPGSSQNAGSSVDLLQQALLGSAAELEKAEQYRLAVRVLRTALLYQPESAQPLQALARVQGLWAQWLAGRHEYAHAVSLLRDSLQRQPDNEAAAAQLEATYHAWMAWSEQSGDPAARDLLAVYLEQERSALGALRQELDAHRARMAAAVAARTAAAQAPPPVAPVMPAAIPAAPAAQPSVVEPAAAAPATAAAPAAPAAAPPATPQTPAAPILPAAAEQEKAPATPPAATPTASPVAAAVDPVAGAAAPVAPSTPPAAAASASPPAPQPQPASPPETPPAQPASPASAPHQFESKEEALETLDAAPDDDSVAEGVFAIYADTMRDLTTALKDRANTHPEQPAWLLLLARAFRRSNSQTMAVIQYQKYIKAAPSPEAYEELAQTYEELGKDDFAKMTRRKIERS
jgi:tetratricopeptide (TPR) repeat protein